MDIKPKNLLKRVLQFAREELERRAKNPESSWPPPAEAPVKLAGTVVANDVGPAHAPDPEVHGLEVLRSHSGGSLTLRWAISEAEVARAHALIQGNPVLCVRLVSFTKVRDDVLREVQDRPGVELAGHCEIGEPAQRAVVSLGLRAGERFVSIAHHVI
ncbi:MAG: hypothetical protein RLZZ450_1918 [Pseudomonadota bacterium]|jgi:hypothetical protein